jgi:hypothetical protein
MRHDVDRHAAARSGRINAAAIVEVDTPRSAISASTRCAQVVLNDTGFVDPREK